MPSIQPRPYGSAFTVSGACGSPVLTSTISPDTGANRSETALTDSTTPNGFFAVAVAPTFGSSTKTTSPSCSAAYAVMPTRTRSSSRLAHSWSRVYRRPSPRLTFARPSRHDDAPLGRLPPPPRPRLERFRRVVDVVAVERLFHLEPQRVARAEPDRLRPVVTPRLEECRPEPRGGRRRRVELEPVLARIACSRDQRVDSRDHAAREAVVPDLRHVLRGEAAHERLGPGPLHRDEPGVRRDVLPARALALPGVLIHMGPVRVDVRRVDREHEPVVREPVHGEVVHDGSPRVAEE